METLRRRTTGQTLRLRQVLGEGTEGRVYAVEADPHLAAKVYRRPDAERARKLEVMLRYRPGDPRPEGHRSIAWPEDLLERGDGTVAGFLMPRAVKMFDIFHLMNTRRRLRVSPAFHYGYLLMTARNLAAAVHAIHARGYVVGDFNEKNVLANVHALVTLIDTDSFQITDPGSGTVYRCSVGTPPYTPREAMGEKFDEFDRTAEHDRFGLAVMIFQLLALGSHPFRGRYLGAGEPPPIPRRIARGWFPYARPNRLPEPLAALVLARGSPWRYRHGPCRPPRRTLPWRALDPRVRALFTACFVGGHRKPARRPSADEWRQVLDRAAGSLRRCRRNRQHRFGGHLHRCPWCALSRIVPDPFPADSGRVAKPPPPVRTPLRKATRRPTPEPAPRAGTSPTRQPVPAPGGGSARKPPSRRKRRFAWLRSRAPGPRRPPESETRAVAGVKVRLPRTKPPRPAVGRLRRLAGQAAPVIAAIGALWLAWSFAVLPLWQWIQQQRLAGLLSPVAVEEGQPQWVVARPEGINLRRAPGTAAELVGSVTAGERVSVIYSRLVTDVEPPGLWHRVRTRDGTEGWLYAGASQEWLTRPGRPPAR